MPDEKNMTDKKPGFVIEEELKKLPSSPGVYLMHDSKDEIIYVGKAVSLKNRVRQYFQPSRRVSPKIEKMISHISYFEYIITDSELEALVLECNLIKEHNPHYNTMLKDDKTYPFIKATTGEAYPRLMMARKREEAGHRGENRVKYYGPYTSGFAVRDTLDLVDKLYFLRRCRRNLPKDIGKERPCLYYHIKQCKAPCQGYISKEEYQENFRQAIEFLEGKYEPVIKMLRDKMEEAASVYAYEEAAQYRDLLNSVSHIAQRQKITSSEQEDRDIIAMARQGNDAVVQVFFIRGGKMIGRDHFHMGNVGEEEEGETLSAFLKQFYSGTPFLPKEILIQSELNDRELLEQWLSGKKGSKVSIRIPQIGQKERLVELARKNAMQVLIKDANMLKQEERRTLGAMKEICALLNLERAVRMESYDISNISGFESVGSMVVFENGKPKKNDYRKFRIKWVDGPNDYASMEEVLTRRFRHGLSKEKEESFPGFSVFPDLILMDGGKGQVHIAEKVLSNLGLSIAVCGMVKDERHRTRGLYYNDTEIPIDTKSEGFHLITRIQDETHRFAIEYHKMLRSKSQTHSVLDDIEGIGENRRRALLKHFRSLDRLRAAGIEELSQIPSMNRKSAENVYNFFHKDSKV